MREWEGDASLSRIVGGHCRQLLLLKRGWHCPLLAVCHLRIEREREDGERGSDSDAKPTGPKKQPWYVHMQGGRWYWTPDNKDMGPVLTYILLQKQVIIGAGHQPWTIWLVQIATMQAWREMIHDKDFWSQLGHPHWGQWNHLTCQIATYAGCRPGGTEPTTRIWGLDTPLLFPLTHTHMQAYKLYYTHMYDKHTYDLNYCLLCSSFQFLQLLSNITFEIPEQEGRWSPFIDHVQYAKTKGKDLVHFSQYHNLFDTLILDGGKA